MNIRRQLHTVYLKHDSESRILSKRALAQILLKIVHFVKTGATFKQIKSELKGITTGSIGDNEINDSLRVLIRENKVNFKNGKYYIHEQYKQKIASAIRETEDLHQFVIDKYFSKCESASVDILNWFQDATVKFFETFSFEWFQQVTQKGKFASNHVDNLHETLDETLKANKAIIEADKEWLKSQYVKFVESEEQKENLLFWYYGISMISSRLITAKNYADEMALDLFKGSKFVLDTNVLMILDLEAHDLSKSLECLERVLIELNVTPVYFYITREEYLRAIDHKKTETIRVFENYDLDVLESSDCPFINTALRRGCKDGEDVKRMFDTLIDISDVFYEKLKIIRYETEETIKAIEEGAENEVVKGKLNAIYKRRTKRDKREKPKAHDSAIIAGASHIRKSEKCWIVTNDSVLKLYAIENALRDENEIAIGLDAFLGMMAIQNGTMGLEASNFAPLFKNIVKLALIPESDAFEVQDLSIILDANLKIQDLSSDRIREIASQVKRMRVRGEIDENISLYLRREIEGEKLSFLKDAHESLEREKLAIHNKEKAERQNKALIQDYRNRRKAELQKQYKRQLLINRLLLILIPVSIGAVLFIVFKYLIESDDRFLQFAVGASVELIFTLLSVIPLNKRFVKRHKEYVDDIENQIDAEILQMKERADNN